MNNSFTLSYRTVAASVLVFVSGSCLAVMGQTNSVDASFNAVPSRPLSSPSSLQQVVQPDGKVIVYGPSMAVNGIAKADIFRLNADGSLDTSFDYCGCGLTGVSSIKLSSDGRLIVGGSLSNTAKIIRLNADGSIDSTFNTPTNLVSGDLEVEAIQPDGKVFGTRRFQQGGTVTFSLYRFNTDGSQDSGFTPLALASGSPVSAVVRVELLPDGGFYLAVTSANVGSSSTLRRRNSNGTVDPTWEQPSFTSSGFPTQVSISDIAPAPDGSIFVTGRWDSVNGTDKRHLVRLFSAGNVDTAFNNPSVFSGTGVELLSDGKFLFSGTTDVGGTARIFRLNSDGTADNTFAMDSAVSSILNGWVVDSSQRIIFFGSAGATRLVRLMPNGPLDVGFDPPIGLYGTVNALARQVDGKVLVAGVFTQMDGTARSTFARVNTDGTLDTSFDPGTGFNNPPGKLVLQPDGKILAARGFASYNGTPVTGIVRINSNGSIDGTFNVTVNFEMFDVSLQADGKILIAGTFSQVNGVGRTGVARLNDDGSLDNTFNPIIGGASVRQIVSQADTKIMIGGGFSGVNGFNRSNLARLNADGGLDQTFNSGVGTVGRIWIQADGKYILGMGFLAGSLTRRNLDGSSDATFTPASISFGSPETSIYELLIRPDGSLIIGGQFLTVGGMTRPNLARLSPNGALDVLFNPTGANGSVRSLVADSAGKVIAGGDFSRIFAVSKPGIARLNTTTFRVKTPFDFDGDGIADLSVTRPGPAYAWYQLLGPNFTVSAFNFGQAGDIVAPADFDGDGKTDAGVFRPSVGEWWFLGSSDGVQRSVRWGADGDIPVPSDFNGDGTADLIVYRPSNGAWYRLVFGGGFANLNFGTAGDKPVIGDFDGDGRSDPAVFRPSTGTWWYAASGSGNVHTAIQWGISTDKPAPADYDGDGKTDVAVYRPSEGTWYILNSGNGSFTVTRFGVAEDKPAPADFDGDGKADIAVFRPSTGDWFLLRSTAGFTGVHWGISIDVPSSGAFVQ
jgi:uncharacterized delta-60 repeat protein